MNVFKQYRFTYLILISCLFSGCQPKKTLSNDVLMTKNLVQNPQDQAKWENAKLTFIENAIEKNRNPKTRLMRSLGLISRFSMGIFLTLAATAYSAIPAVFFTKGQNGNTHATNYYQLLIPFTFVSTGALLAWKGGAPFNFLNQKDKIDKQIIKTEKEQMNLNAEYKEKYPDEIINLLKDDHEINNKKLVKEIRQLVLSKTSIDRTLERRCRGYLDCCIPTMATA